MNKNKVSYTLRDRRFHFYFFRYCICFLLFLSHLILIVFPLIIFTLHCHAILLKLIFMVMLRGDLPPGFQGLPHIIKMTLTEQSGPGGLSINQKHHPKEKPMMTLGIPFHTVAQLSCFFHRHFGGKFHSANRGDETAYTKKSGVNQLCVEHLTLKFGTVFTEITSHHSHTFSVLFTPMYKFIIFRRLINLACFRVGLCLSSA